MRGRAKIIAGRAIRVGHYSLLKVVILLSSIVGSTAGFCLIVGQQLKRILSYIKAQIVSSYVYRGIEFQAKEIINDDVLFRIEPLIEEIIVLTEIYEEIREVKK
ncbi:hypothetical protein DTX80_17060 [Bacilli bacterium]|nr:hypothetical protein DEJ64_17280 [Bacilli bacterium]PZD83379.1 hypothetical protein DEJ60_17260 [Bacilli bacterium]PZD85046.1 hypothetical protein DEJ66_17300 [Bacilli bacterium]RCO04420.1 hypothetical protein DTX80_17060 [Bacilli bacterium]RCO08622.1 hypothetical protein DTX79_14295 [Bacilli bacterium]